MRTRMGAERRGFSIRVFLPGGMPDGLRIIDKSNWNGLGVVCPRAIFPEAKKRPEFERTGVYVLVGPAGEGELPRAYIGEGDPVRPRLEQHSAKKDFWTWAAMFTSKDANLNKAHVQYLEARLYELAQAAKRSDLDNLNQPAPPTLSEADEAEAEGFLDEVLLCAPVIGLNIFERPSLPAPETRVLHLRAKGIEARGYEAPDGFVVMEGSQAVADEVASIHDYLSTLRRTLTQRGVLSPAGESLTVTQDYTFNSPSTAAGTLLGRSANGRVEWKDDSGRTLKQLQGEGENAQD